MKDVSFRHAELIMLPFSEDEAEHYGYDAQLFSMDLADAIHADAAIEKWLMPQTVNWSARGRELRREASRVCISQGIPFSSFWLPGIDDRWQATGDVKEHARSLQIFQKRVWERLFGELYHSLPLEQYRLRVDKGFERFPDSPDLWATPEYSEWPPGF